MIKILFFILIFISNIFATVISANQGRVSVTGGSIDVSSQGVTQVVNSGEITFIGDGKAPTKARKVQKGDLNNLFDELEARDSLGKIILKFSPVNAMVAKKIRLALLQKGFSRSNIRLKRKGRLSQLYLAKVSLNSIRTLFPPYYKIAKRFFSKKKNNGKVPILTVRLSDMKRYYRNIFRKYGR